MEMYKLAKGISSTVIKKSKGFENDRKYNLRSQKTFEISFRNLVYNDTELISNLKNFSLPH